MIEFPRHRVIDSLGRFSSSIFLTRAACNFAFERMREEKGGTCRRDKDGQGRWVIWRSKTRIYSLGGDEAVGSDGVSLRHQVSSFACRFSLSVWRGGAGFVLYCIIRSKIIKVCCHF